MRIRKHLIAISFVLIGMAASPPAASADWLITPFIGAVFGGSADFGGGIDDEFERRFTYGLSLGAMGGGIAGFEIDFGYSPNFFETLVDEDDDFTFADDSNVVTLMGNLILGIPVGGDGPAIRPYATAGVGLIRTQVTSAGDLFEVDSNDFGFNVGGGVQGFFSDNVGLRGDIRYFRAVTGDDEEDDGFDIGLSDFKFWRATVGVVFSFGSR